MADDAISAQFKADVQTRLSNLSADAQAKILEKTGVDTTQQSVAKGASSAVGLIKGGYDPNNSNDNANLVHVIAGGLCLVPAVGPVLGAAVETLWVVGNAIACPITDAFASVGIGSPCGAGCKSTGNWTAASILAANAGAVPAMPRGSFAQLAVGALATYAAQAANCKGGIPPGLIVDAVVQMWNQTHAGPAVAYLVPPLAVLPGSLTGTPTLLVTWGSTSGSTPAGQAGKDPWAFYGFGPAALAQPYASVGNVADDSTWGFATPFTTAPAPPGMVATSPRIVMVNSGAVIPRTTVVGHASSLALGAVAGGLLYAYVTGEAVKPVFEGAFKILAGWIKEAGNKVRRLG